MTIKEIYDALVSKPDLHAFPKLYDNDLIWHLYKNAYIRVWCDNGDIFAELFGGDGFTGSLIRWHFDEYEVIRELYALGKRGNMLVLKKTLWGTSIFYSGPSESFPLSDRHQFHFGKKKWDWGPLVYLEQK